MTKEFVTRKFTLPAELDDELVELANEHHNRNVSKLLRCAISDHERTLDGKDEFAIQKLETEIESLEESIEKLAERFEDSLSEVNLGQNGVPAKQNELETNVDSHGVQQQIQRVLLDEGSLSLKQIDECADADLLAVQDAIEALLEYGYVAKETERDPTRYRIKQ